MKTRLLLLALMAGCQMFAASAEDDLKATIEKWKTAVVKKDKATLEKHTSPNVTYSHSNALMENRDQMIAAMISPDMVYKSMDMTETTYRMFGNVGIVQTKMMVNNAQKGVPKTTPLSVLMVWVKDKGVWQLTARQTTRLP
ncbi:MAG: nuclear transport factor 2 family protein [Acidobacteria bacterium]|nr:nuclear transport factor 2 family protein [Acidobacteriota bacterium]